MDGDGRQIRGRVAHRYCGRISPPAAKHSTGASGLARKLPRLYGTPGVAFPAPRSTFGRLALVELCRHNVDLGAIGFNFGDGHLHNEDLINAVQTEAAFEPGECVVAWVESESFGRGVQHYQLIDAALGVIERGTWKVADAVAEQPWLPNGPIPTEVTRSLRGALR